MYLINSFQILFLVNEISYDIFFFFKELLTKHYNYNFFMIVLKKNSNESLVQRTTLQCIEPQNWTKIHRYKRWDRTLIYIVVSCTAIFHDKIWDCRSTLVTTTILITVMDKQSILLQLAMMRMKNEL